MQPAIWHGNDIDEHIFNTKINKMMFGWVFFIARKQDFFQEFYCFFFVYSQKSASQ